MNLNHDIFDQTIDAKYIKNYQKTHIVPSYNIHTVIGFMKKHLPLASSKFVLYFFIFMANTAIIMLEYFLSNKNDDILFLIIIIVVFVVISGIALFVFFDIFKKKMIKRYIILDDFATKNNLSYLPLGYGANNNGCVFGVGSDCNYIDMIKSIDDNFEFSNYEYSIESEESRQTVRLGYIMVRLNRKLPNIILDSKKNNLNFLGLSISSLPVAFNKDQILALEGDFNSHFTLYVPKDYERDALYVFNPQLMALFIDETGDFDSEIVDDRLYIYSKRPFKLDDLTTLRRIFNIIDVVMNKTIDETKRYSDEKVGSFQDNVIHNDGRRLRKTFKWNTMTVIIVSFVLLNIIMRFVIAIIAIILGALTK